MIIVDWILSLTLWFVTYVQPMILGARICKNEQAKPSEVLNITLAITFIWFLEFLDSLILGRLIAMRWLYVTCRILVAWYCMHPRMMGALKFYQNYLQDKVETHAGVVDRLITRNIKELRSSGPWQYLTGMISSGARSAQAAVSNVMEEKKE